MTQPLSDRELRELLGQASEGPWYLATNKHPTIDGQEWGAMELQRHPAGGAGKSLFIWTGKQQKADARLCAAAPALAEEVLRLKEALREIGYGSAIGTAHKAREVARAALQEGSAE